MNAIYETLSFLEKRKLDSAVKLTFSGDLILLEDGVRNAWNGSGYDFSSAFEYSSKYISEADLAVGVFEGPCAGGEYSTSNYGDGKPLRLNFPDSFAKAVSNAGFDLVTTANNHLLDKGSRGALRTLDILDSVGLSHIGSYRSQAEKDTVTIKEIAGIKFAFLAYTAGCNLGVRKRIRGGDLAYLTSFLDAPSSDEFDSYKEMVFRDFERAKAENPDVIIVLPHMGTQFSHSSNEYQEIWYKIFADAGAHIVVANHSHAVQPVEFRMGMLIMSCLGNFTNSYVKHDGDASALVEVYFDKLEKSAFGVGIIPMYTQIPIGKTPRALPIYDIMTDPELSAQIGTYEFERIKQVYGIVTEVMLGHKLPIDMVTSRHYKTEKGFSQDITPLCSQIKRFDDSVIVRFLTEAKAVCFVGDSVTGGSRNGGTGWYRPLSAHFENMVSYEKAWDGGTVQTLLDHIDEISGVGAETYVVAIGTNDVRYRNMGTCAMTAKEYIEKILAFTNEILEKAPGSRFLFIAPWMALSNDPYNKCDLSSKTKAIAVRDALLAEYSGALEEFCLREKHLYLNPNPHIRQVLSLNSTKKYLVDHIHPGRLYGVGLYSEAAVLAGL
ncbi:MAG: CapA family protein [Eggerthellaceae bacterium]|nr:CapA family protein [Eggerthellaceae bacterium]